MTARAKSDYDVVIVGGGPAGLSAALVLGRCLRRVIVFDHGRQRNARARHMHNFLTRDGISPTRWLKIAQAEVRRCGVELRTAEVVEAVCLEPGFDIRLAGGAVVRCRKLLLATGVCDRLPEIPGLDDLYGVSVHHCPYCDGYEWRGRPLAVYGKGRSAAMLALKLKTWSHDIALCSDGDTRLSPSERDRFAANGIAVYHHRIERLEGRGGRLTRICFHDAPPLERSALFFATTQDPGCQLAAQLGCRMKDAVVATDLKERTGVPGLFVAGDASKDVQFVIVAAAEGAKAGVTINEELASEQGQQDPPRPARGGVRAEV